MSKLKDNARKDVKKVVTWIKKHKRLVVIIVVIYLTSSWLFSEDND